MPWNLPLVAATSADGGLTAGQDGATIRRTVLPGGVRVLSEHVPGIRSVSVGLWVPVGSRDETDGHFGSTHFLEHLLFKGTRTRSATQIAEAFDAVGGEANAATGKEHTCYYARVLDTDLPMAIDVLTDMLTSSRIDAGELETERGVILEELAMNDDDPGDVAHEAFSAAVLAHSALGRPIGGTPETIRAVPRDAVWEHYRAHYRPETLVVTAAGGVDHDALCALVAEGLQRGGWDADPERAPRARRSTVLEPQTLAAGTEKVIARPVEQTNVIVGAVGLGALDDRRFALTVLNTLLGGGMSSRLFQEIREKRGLAYTTYAFGSPHAETGTFGLYAGCAPAKAAEVESLLVRELDRLADGGVTEDELRRGIGQLTGGMVLGLEDTGARMSRLGRAEVTLGELYSIDESLDALRSVTAAQVQELAQTLASRPRHVVRVGPHQAF